MNIIKLVATAFCVARSRRRCVPAVALSCRPSTLLNCSTCLAPRDASITTSTVTHRHELFSMDISFVNHERMTNHALGANRRHAFQFMGQRFYNIISFGGRALPAPVDELDR